MVEIWIKFGKTEVFSDIPQEATLNIVEPQPTWETPNPSEVINNLFDEYQDLMPHEASETTILVDYIHGVYEYDRLLFSLLVKIIEKGVEPEKIKVITSAWRYGTQDIELEVRDKLRQEFRRIGIQKIESTGEITWNKNGKIDIAVLPTAYWQNKITDPTHMLEKHNHIPEPKLIINPTVGYSGYISEIKYGDKPEITNIPREETYLIKVENNPEVVILGSNGHPTDYTLYSCMHILTSIQGKVEDTVILFIAECGKGLGPETFIQKLINIKTGESGEDDENGYVIKRWLELTDKTKVCMTTLLPSSIVETLLNAKHSTVLDDALVYAWRIKSKSSHVAVIPNPLFALIRM
ncbi:MAG TPA: hypothetical protein EYH45_02390 [Candidatus Caldiarchaeum subterraneum]|uniref:Lactate racemase C-terminal domain-containing protein n=1 Tax=Caldiarchaeum subterraneum TaxID=311458 RepID=A0A832ZUV9_CALS0|nr:hypothetical protein [Candidatus Caldarchaeum subterraneum]